MSSGVHGPASAANRTKTVLSHLVAHLGAMHLSGALLALTVLVPSAWTLAEDDVAAADGNPSLALLIVMLGWVAYHVVVQIPSGLLGTWLGRNRTGIVSHAFALAVAGALTAVLLWGFLKVREASEFWSLWAECMWRSALGLAAYTWLFRFLSRPARGPRPGLDP